MPHVWDIAPLGFSGRGCPKCGKFFTDAEIATMDALSGNHAGRFSCLHCGALSTPETSKLAIRAEDAELLNSQNIYTRKWYHATVVKDWHSRLKSMSAAPLVHLGTKDASIARAKHISDYLGGKSKWYIYEVAINSDAQVAANVLDDEDDKAPITSEKNRSAINRGYELRGVTRYVNRFEAEGTVSLLANARSFRVISVH